MYLYMRARECQLFTDEGSRRLPKRLNYCFSVLASAADGSISVRLLFTRLRNLSYNMRVIPRPHATLRVIWQRAARMYAEQNSGYAAASLRTDSRGGKEIRLLRLQASLHNMDLVAFQHYTYMTCPLLRTFHCVITSYPESLPPLIHFVCTGRMWE